MSSVLRSVRKRKKGTLGAVDVIDREGYAELEVGQGGVDPVLGSAGVDGGVARRGSDRAPNATPAKTQSAGAVMVATPGRSGWPASACRFACPGYVTEPRFFVRSAAWRSRRQW